MKEIILKISDSEFIKIINLCAEGDHIYRYDPVEAFLYRNSVSNKIFINGFLIDVIQSLIFFLTKSINNELNLDKSISNDLGFLWNEYLQEKDGHNFVESKGEIKNWIGQDYLLWCPRGISTWIYNKNNAIILEITPSYRWHFSDPEPNEQFISYDEFIKNYQPITNIEIDKKTAKRWLHQVEDILKTIEENDKKFLYPTH